MRFVVLGVFQQHVVHVGAGILEQLVGAVEDDESDLTVAEDAQLVRLLHQTKLPLGEGYLVKRGANQNIINQTSFLENESLLKGVCGLLLKIDL